MSRVGLYGFCIGYVEHLQTGIAESIRGRVNAIDKAFAKLAELCIYAASIIFSTPARFQYVIYISAGSILLASVLYIGWALKCGGDEFLAGRQQLSQEEEEEEDEEGEPKEDASFLIGDE